MSDNITLPRADAEQVREAIRVFYNKYSAEAAHKNAGRAIDALDAALAEPPAKPEPATDEQIAESYKASENDDYWLDYPDGWRAAERWHGIRARGSAAIDAAMDASATPAAAAVDAPTAPAMQCAYEPGHSSPVK